MKFFKLLNLELIFWAGGLLFLAMVDPYGSQHLNLCPISGLGWDFCPGCGLGHSISYLLHGYITESWSAHPLGIPALGLILFRIFRLAKFTIMNYKLKIIGG